MLNASCVLFKGCVEYDGRAKSKTDVGIYLVIIKSDYSIQVHCNVKNKPINYINANNSIIEENQWVFFNKNERIILHIQEILNSMGIALLTGVDKKIKKTEQDLVDKLINNISQYIDGDIQILTQYPTPVGPIDVVCLDEVNKIAHIIEVKRRKPSVSAIYQLKRYMDNVLLNNYTKIGYLAAPEFSSKHDVLNRELGFKNLIITFDGVD